MARTASTSTSVMWPMGGEVVAQAAYAAGAIEDLAAVTEEVAAAANPCPTRRLQGGPVVSIYAQPGMSGTGPGSCSDESANLESIMMHLINNNPDFADYTVDTSITSFGQADLAERLAAATFFFMVDMETSATGL